MLMLKKKSELPIGKELSSCISSGFNPTPPQIFPSIHQKNLQIKSQYHTKSNPQSTTLFVSDKLNTQFPISVPPKSPEPPHQIHFHHEPISSNPPQAQTLVSTPHKRPIMTQNQSLSLPNHFYETVDLDSASTSCSCFSLFSVPFATKSVASKFLRQLQCTRLLRLHLRFLILVSPPSLYFLLNPRRFFVLSFISIFALSFMLLISLNLALPRLPSICLLLTRSFQIKHSSSAKSKSLKPVVWSIGSKPKSEKKAHSGSWVQVYSSGDVYEGEFHKGKCSGSGVYYYSMSGRYEGDWVDGKYDGYGVETWARGSRYRGQYRQGLRHGIGVYRFYTGDVYAGEWSNGQCHGCGIHTCEDGSKYAGEFKWGVKHGLGHYHFRNGDAYAGEYFADKMHGFGVYMFANGHRYEGAWHEGRRQGLGKYTFRNGETQLGHWQNGILNVPSVQYTHPGSPYAVNHSKVLHAVEEAKRAAEKSNALSKVDERVNKAVAAANKAANAARVAAVKAVQSRMHHNSSDDTQSEIV